MGEHGSQGDERAARIVDARGKSCPEPVILTKKAMEEADRVEVLVDSPTSRQSVTGLAEEAGWDVRVEDLGGEFRIALKRSTPHPAQKPEGPRDAQTSSCVLVMDEGLGVGPDELRIALMKAFLHTLTGIAPLPEALIFVTNGVRLVCRSSAVIDDLKQLESAGVRLLACGTCLSYFGLTDQVDVGKVSNMHEIAETLLSSGNVVRM